MKGDPLHRLTGKASRALRGTHCAPVNADARSLSPMLAESAMALLRGLGLSVPALEHAPGRGKEGRRSRRKAQRRRSRGGFLPRGAQRAEAGKWRGAGRGGITHGESAWRARRASSPMPAGGADRSSVTAARALGSARPSALREGVHRGGQLGGLPDRACRSSETRREIRQHHDGPERLLHAAGKAPPPPRAAPHHRADHRQRQTGHLGPHGHALAASIPFRMPPEARSRSRRRAAGGEQHRRGIPQSQNSAAASALPPRTGDRTPP